MKKQTQAGTKPATASPQPQSLTPPLMPDAYYKDRWFEVENAIIDAVATLHLLGFYLDTDGDAMDGVIACLASRSGHRLSDAYYLPATAAGEGGAA